MSDVINQPFKDYRSSVAEALDALSAADRLPGDGLIIIKPNLTNTSPPPVTTPVECAEAVALYCREHTGAEIAIGEGCGSGRTRDTFEKNGYADLAKRLDLRLIDFNEAPAVLLKRSDTIQLKEFHLPEVARDAFIISLPILKDHSMTTTTIAMKNMFGLAPAPFYKGSWNKSKLHSPDTHASVVDVCLYKRPDLCVVDAVVALTGSHLSGTPKRLDAILASFDPVAIDAEGTALLGHDPDAIKYIRLGREKLNGTA